MDRIFRASNLFNVPDGTKVASLFNSAEVTSNLLNGSKKGFSIALGEILPDAESKIHLHPLVKQVTYVLEGSISIFMKDNTSPEKYKLEIKKGEAVLTEEGTFFQLLNESENICRVLYIVSPGFLFETADDKIVYNDAVVLERNWQELQEMNWEVPEVLNSHITPEARQAAYERIIKKNLNR